MSTGSMSPERSGGGGGGGGGGGEDKAQEEMETGDVVSASLLEDASKGDETETGDVVSVSLPEDASKGANQSLSRASSSSESNDKADDEQVESLEKAIALNPMDYNAHVEYIQCLRKLGYTEKLQQARESMNELFPLTSTMWQEWVKDESSISANSQDFTKIEKLYERGVHEYLSVPLWCDYLEFVQEHDQSVLQCSPAGITKIRDLFERALTSGGLHVTEGNKLWDTYREYEQAIFIVHGDSNNEEKATQIQRIRSLFHRQLSVPLVDLESTLMTYKHWEAEQHNLSGAVSSELDGVPSNVNALFERAMKMYNARSLYEDHLSNENASDADKLQHFTSYLKFEESSGDPSRVQILYERAISEFPVSSDLWSSYTSYLDQKLKVPNVLRDAYSRATRNCSWVGDLWIAYLLCLERIHASEEDICTVFGKSMQCIFTSFKEYMNLFLTRIDGLRRRLCSSDTKEVTLDYHLIRATFQHAVEYLSPQLVSTEDIVRLHAYWAYLENTLGKDLSAARGVWENLIKKSGFLLEVWQSYIDMEIGVGNINEARAIYKRCYSKRFPGNGSEDICHLWLQFERERGTLEDYDCALQKVTPRLQELVKFRMQQDTSAALQSGTFVEKSAAKKRKMKSVEKNQSSKIQKPGFMPSEVSEVHDSGKTNKSKEMAGPRIDDNANLPALEETGSGITSKKYVDSFSKEPGKKFYTDQCTAFISNLSLKAHEGHLNEFFQECGGVTSIRILRDKSTGKSRGLAYVEFSDDVHLAAAVAKNNKMLLGRKLYVVRSDPKQRKTKLSSDYSSGTSHDNAGNNKTVQPPPSSSGILAGRRKPLITSTFAVPRSVIRPLGFSKKGDTHEDPEKPKSNEEFRNMLLQK